MKKTLGIVLVALIGLASAHGQTIFTFSSSPTSFVGAGRSLYATPADGYTIGVSDTWRVQVWCYGPDFHPTWDVLFQAANYAPVTVGHYADTREPGVDPTRPSLYFFGEGRASSGPTGYFDILELNLDTNGAVVSFAADFVQYDHGDPAAWNAGSIRFNSAIPIPEPALVGPLALSCCWWILRRRRV